MYAPTEDKTDIGKEKFNDDLHTTINRTPKSDIVIVLGDANAKLGKEDVYNEVSGKHALRELSNRNGEMLLEFALGNNLKVMSTQFQYKKIRKGTWLAPDQMTLNQIDHVLINSEKKELIKDIRTMRVPNIDYDHYLLKIIVNQKLDCTGMWDKSNLKNPIKLQEYRRALYTKLSKQTQHNTTQHQDVEQEWEQIKMAITEAVNEVIQKQGKKQRSE